MNTDIAELCAVLRSILRAIEKGKITKADKKMCEELLGNLEIKYRAGAAAIAAAAQTLEE